LYRRDGRPSRPGTLDVVSHNSYTAPIDIANGVNVLLRTLLAIDRGALGP